MNYMITVDHSFQLICDKYEKMMWMKKFFIENVKVEPLVNHYVIRRHFVPEDLVHLHYDSPN